MRGGHRRSHIGGNQNGRGGAGFGAESAARFEARQPSSHGPHNAPAAAQRAQGDRRVGGQNYPNGHFEGFQETRSDEHAGDDSHGLLRVVGTVRQTECRRRDQLELAEILVHLRRGGVAEQPVDQHHHGVGGKHPDERRADNHLQGKGPLAGGTYVEGFETVAETAQQAHARHGGAGVAADQGVRRTGGQAEPPGDQIPGDGARQSGHNHVGGHQAYIHEAPAHRPGNRRAEHESRGKIEERGPQHGLKRCEHPRSHNRGDGIRRIVKTVDVIEHQRNRDDEYGEGENGHASCS